MRTRTWLGMVSGLCLASVTARADAPPLVVAPGAPVALPTVDLQVDASDAGTAAVWEAMKSGKMTPEDAWKKGLLDAQAVQAGLSQGLAGGEDDNSRKLRLALGSALAQHAPEVVKDALKLPKQVQLALADYYASVSDERAVALYEAVLGQTKAFYEQGLIALAMGEFWSQKGQPQKAQEAFERGRKVLVGNNPHLAAEMLLNMARAWAKAKDEDKARQFYAKTAADGDGWMTVLSFYDQASPLWDAGKLAQARVLLSQPLRATSHQLEGEIAQNAWLASLDYQEGKLEDALHHGQAVMKASQGITFQPGSIKNLYEMGHDIYLRAGGWKTQPIQCDVKEIVFKANPSHPDQPLYARFRIKTYGDQPVTATVDNPAIQVRVLPIDDWQKNRLEAYEEEEVIVQMSAHDADKSRNQNQLFKLSLRTALHNANTFPIAIILDISSIV